MKPTPAPNDGARRSSVSMPASLFDAAEKRMADRMHNSFSDYVAWLIRRDLGLDDPKAKLDSTAPPVPAASTAPAAITKYPRRSDPHHLNDR